MENLEKLEQELYEEKSTTLAKRLRQRILFPKTLQKVNTAWTSEGPQQPVKGTKPGKKINFLALSLGVFVVVAILLGAAFVFFYLGTQGQEAELTIHKKDTLEAGEVVTIPVVYRNTSRTTLVDAELTVLLPEGTFLREGEFDRPAPNRINQKIEDLAPGEEGVFEISARFFGYEGEEKKVEAVLLYKPETLRARFSARASELFTITRVPLTLVLDLPSSVAQGQDINATIRFSSTASKSFDSLWVRLEYPPGFSFASAAPESEFGNNIWSIGSLAAGEERAIAIKGTLSGPERDLKPFGVFLGAFNPVTKEWRTYREITETTAIAATPLAVSLSLDGVRERTIKPGERLNFSLKYRNNTQSVLKNISIKALLEGDVLDFSTLSIEQGVFNFTSRALVWNTASAGDLKELAPGQGGEFRFNIKTKDQPPMRSAADKNQLVKIRADISPAFIPEELAGISLASKDSLEFKVKTKVAFRGKSLYRSSPLVNSGPLGPRVGQKTIYTMVWETRNFTNDLSNVEIKALLPANVTWENQHTPRDASLVFDEISHEVRWTVGKVEAGVGILSPALSVAFQVGVVPSEADQGKVLTLLNESKLIGKDLFTNEGIEERVEFLTTELREDPGVLSQDWVVQEPK